MGNNKPLEKKRKKKGRPSLLDLQKRSLRLQKQQQQQQRNPNPSPNPYLRFPNPVSGRRITRRNPQADADPDAEDDDDDDDEGSTGNRREKKLKLVLRLPHGPANSPAGPSDSGPSGSEADEDENGGRKIGHGDRDKAERRNSSKATDQATGEPSDSGPTPLPDKKLLVFILDRLQKKDTYGVFSEPVDPKELPDYHEVVKHPMDFGTVRKKLSCEAYTNLEQFEKDIFLISSNAMRYNAPDTVYYRQARSIQELAKKDFENLRQESDDNDMEPKTVTRRGRPPSKNAMKRAVGRPPTDRAASDFSSDATLANASDSTHWSSLNHDLSRKGPALDKPGTAGVSTRSSLGLRNNGTFSWMSEHKAEKNEEYSGSALRGIPMKYGKKPLVIDENRRNTYRHPLPSTCEHEPPLLATFDGEKQLIPVGLHMEHAYARSLVRFAANLGPVGWAIAAKKIERALPHGTKFGRGWVGDSEAPSRSQPPLISTSPPRPTSLPTISPCTTVSISDGLPQRLEPPSNEAAVEEGHFSRTRPPPTSVASDRSSDPVEGSEARRGSSFEAGSNLPSQSKAPYQLQRSPGFQPTANGFSTPFGFNLASQLGKMIRPSTPSSFVSDTPMTHARVLDMVSRGGNSFIHPAPMGQLDPEKVKLVGNASSITFGGSTLRGLSLQPKPDSVPPDLNVRFQSPGSPASGVIVDSQQPDLALQL